VFVTPAWPPGHLSNGIVYYTGQMREALQRCGVSVGIVAPGDATDEEENVCRMSENGRRRSLVTRMGWKLRPYHSLCHDRAHAVLEAVARFRAAGRIDLLQIEDSFGIARWVMGAADYPVVIRLHGPWFLVGRANGEHQAGDFRRRVQYEGDAIRKAAGVSAPSHDVLTQTQQFYSFPLPLGQCILNPARAVAPSEAWKVENCQKDAVLFVGRFDRVKGGDTMIQAFRRICEVHPSATLHFVGPDRGLRDEAGRSWAFREFTEQCMPGAIASGRITYWGEQPHAALDALRRRAMVTVVCSRYETFGNVLAEALALGCAVVATRTGGLAEIVSDERNGLLCRVADPEDLASKALRILRDPGLAATLGHQAWVDCRQKYDADLLAGQTVAFFERVIAAYTQKR
jgi:glycosyltransferase involved in cell wall biosynthesis